MKWKKEVLPSATPFADALYPARAVEEQEHQLSIIHPTKQIMWPSSGNCKEPVTTTRIGGGHLGETSANLRGLYVVRVEVLGTSGGCALNTDHQGKSFGKPTCPMSGTSSVITSYNESEEDRCCHLHRE